ncbi:hypothetical protein A9267_13090 [Shewanella sp. UCD-FRSSP16_17]|uniref:hypothetical protein n=1 Tax=unclassified Shewanella TaxID=196818 RepID=UPI0007EEAF3B|nr:MULTISPECIES: hypothetical protein [unclassified Shewanella]MBQ4890702.1 hypothetical protein [Shewanella sp. MMG014]OBT06828.1 hypothetical protein A9267_13090 [Shewanella sp. UCD-FRSSP16_17]
MSLSAIKTCAKLMVAVMLLQFISTNLGEHQLHLGDGENEQVNHSHIVFSAPADVCDKADDFAHLFNATSTASEIHNHTLLADNQDYELCLDCQCHGGHSATIDFVAQLMPVAIISEAPKTVIQTYIPPEARLSYRPPILLIS